MLVKASCEQKNVIEKLKTSNVLVDSVAGSGKTTTNLHIAKHFNEANILLLTYNAKLKLETREKVVKYEIKNLEVHSYHSFCVKYYSKISFRDSEISKVINQNYPVQKKFRYDILVLDESQDINPLYFKLIYKIFLDNENPNVKMCVLGDKCQSIYDFNNADNRFIIYSDLCFNFTCLDWVKCTLNHSFRVTNEIANFINNCMLNESRIKALKKGTRPEYVICDTFSTTEESIPFTRIKQILRLGYLPEDIFVLAPSVKSVKSPVRVLENQIKLGLTEIPVYVPNNDEEKIDNSIIENKLVISTFHQTKGLERKIVLVFNFDNSYLTYYKKNHNPKKCPNELYVATTRAIDHLIVFHHYNNDYLPFLNKNKLNRYAQITKTTRLMVSNQKKNKNLDTSPTDLCNHLPDEIVNECLKFFKIKNLQKKKNQNKYTIKNTPKKNERGSW